VPLGKIVTTHGIEGWLKLKPYNPRTVVFFAVPGVFLEKDGNSFPWIVELTRRHKGHFLLKLRGIDSINDAERWVGAVLSVAADTLNPLEPGEFYHYQAIGLDVFDLAGRRIGVITRVWFKDGGDLFVVSGESKEYLIPAVREIIEKVDLTEKKMIINPPEGLLDL
jgi:16S rRNA processing protein RimM